jgi:regulator of sirC expression with transglutaminase-like and TPR domain
MVWEHLARLGPQAFPSLRLAGEARDARLRLRARFALQQLSLDEVERELQAIAAAGAAGFELERAFCAVARIEHPELSGTEVGRTLEEMAQTIRPGLRGIHQPMGQVRAFNRAFHDELGFTSEGISPGDPRQLCLNDVLERRNGHPVALVAVCLLLGSRLGLPLSGVGLPNHVLVKYSADGEELYVDPSDRGQVYSRRQCLLTFLRDYYPKDSYLQELTPRELTSRALRVLLLVYSKQQNKGHVRRLARILENLQIRERLR